MVRESYRVEYRVSSECIMIHNFYTYLKVRYILYLTYAGLDRVMKLMNWL